MTSIGTTAAPLIHYVVELQHSGLNIRFLLNGVELFRGVPDDKKIIQQKVNGWMIAGENKIELHASAPSPAQPANPIDLKCLIFRGPHGRQPEEEEALARYAERDKSKLPVGVMQRVWQTSIVPDPWYGPWQWESANSITQDAATVEAARRVIATVALALNNHDAARVAALFRVYIEESSRAYGLNAERMTAEMSEWVNSWTAAPLVMPGPEAYALAIEPNQRLLRVERKDKLPVFTTNPETPGSGLTTIYLANTMHGWLIVR